MDNLAVVFDWDSKIVKNHRSATIIIRAIHLLSDFLGVWVHVQHVPRCSDTYSVLADHLSRKSSTTKDDLQRLSNIEESNIGGALQDWCQNPSEDWPYPPNS